MSIWNFVSKVGKEMENHVERTAQRTEDEMRRYLRKKSDEEIERAYRKRYDNPNIKAWQRYLLEEEAHRRGIS